MPSSRLRLTFASINCSVVADAKEELGGDKRVAGSDPSPATVGAFFPRRGLGGKNSFSRSAAAARPRTP
jgi:hypothetical protein